MILYGKLNAQLFSINIALFDIINFQCYILVTVPKKYEEKAVRQ